MNLYVVYVQCGKEEYASTFLHQCWTDERCDPFVPRVERFFVQGGKTIIERQICFPGYLFVRTKTSAVDFLQAINPLIHKYEWLYKVLNYGDPREIAVYQKEQDFLERLLLGGECIPVSQAHKNDEGIQIISGPLIDFEENIEHIDRHKREATVRLELLGSLRSIKLGVEVTS